MDTQRKKQDGTDKPSCPKQEPTLFDVAFREVDHRLLRIGLHGLFRGEGNLVAEGWIGFIQALLRGRTPSRAM